MKILQAQATHIPGMLELLRQVGQVHYEGRPDLFRCDCLKYDEAALKELLRDPERPIFIAEENGFVLGYCFCVHKRTENSTVLLDHHSLYIDDLCVDEGCRGRHIGTALYRHAHAYAKQMGCDSVTLNVWSFNESAVRFYEKLGLRPQKTIMETLL